MKFSTLKKSNPRMDLVEEALDAIRQHDPPEYEEAKRIMQDAKGYSAQQIADVLREEYGVESMSAQKVIHFRRKLREGRVKLP